MLRLPISTLCLSMWIALCLGAQTSRLEIEHSWDDGMTANICMDHDMSIDCGWEMEILFAKPLTGFDIWSAVVKSREAHSSGTRVVIRNLEWSQAQPTGSCHRFNAYFSSMPQATATFTRICSGWTWSDVGGSGPSGIAAPPAPPAGEPGEPDYQVDIKSSWRNGLNGEICLFHTAPITCGSDAEIVFRPPIGKLEIWSMAIVDEIRTNSEVRYLLKNMGWGAEQPNNPQCHNFLARHPRGQKPAEISGHYIRTCHNGQDNYDPNQGGTVPPATTPATSTTTTTTTTTSTTTLTTPTTTTTTPTTTTTTTKGTTKSTTPGTTASTTTTVSPTRPNNQLEFDYYDALKKSMLFYFVQRSGPINDNIIPWRTEDSAMNDGSDIPRDLVGGWYDAGDHVKFNFPMAGSTTTLLWGLLQWKDAYQAAGSLDMMYKLIKHPLDYFIKCWDNDNTRLYGQVGDGNIDHATWGRSEDMTMPRPTFYLDKDNGGSDLAGETAAAMAAGALAFEVEEPAYASKLLQAAEQVYAFADTYRREYHLSIPNAANFYKSFGGYNDELCWGAAWLLKATGREEYRTKARAAMANMNQYPVEYSWDEKAIGCYILMYQMSSGAERADYEAKIVSFMNNWVNFQGSVTKTGCGLAWLRQWGSLRYAANSALIALLAAENGINPTVYRPWAEKQIKYMLGANNKGLSYQVGFGDNFPLRPHHQSATCPLGPAPCDWNTFNNPAPNAHELTGALVGGPGQGDEYTDDRTDYVKNEVTTDYNAGFQSTLAGLIHLDLTGDLPNAVPDCPKP